MSLLSQLSTNVKSWFNITNGGNHKYFFDQDMRLGDGFQNPLLFNGQQQTGYIEDDTLVNTSYARNTDYYAIMNKITEKSSDIPIDIFIKTADGLELVTEGDFFDFMRHPNPEQTEKELRMQNIGYILMTGDMFLRGEMILNSTAIDVLTNLESNLTELNIQTDGVVKSYDYTKFDKAVQIPPEEVYHGKFFNPTRDGINRGRGMSPIQAGNRSLVASNELIEANAHLLKNKGVSGIITNKSGKNVGSTEMGLIQTTVNARLGGSNKAGGISATTADLDFLQLSMSAQDLQIIQSHPITLRAACRLYNLDSVLFGDPDQNTKANRGEAEKAAYTDAYIPMNNRYISYLMRFVVPGWNLRDGKQYILKQRIDEIKALAEDQGKIAKTKNTVSDGITKVLTSAIPQDSKEWQLINIYKLTEEDAKNLVNGTENETSE